MFKRYLDGLHLLICDGMELNKGIVLFIAGTRELM